MRNTELSILINQPATHLFQYATDPRHLADLCTEPDQVLKVSDGPLAKGSSFRVGNSEEDQPRRDLVYHVVGFDAPRSFAVKTSGPLLTYTSQLTFHDQSGSTRVTESIEMESQPFPLSLLGGWVLRRIRQAHEKNLARMKATGERSL